MRIIVLLAAISLYSLSLRADQWTFFHPDLVLTYSCTVREVAMQEHGVGDTRQVWQAEAAAERKDREKWAMSIGEFSHTIKGRHAAEKTCTRWMDQATKRIKGAK